MSNYGTQFIEHLQGNIRLLETKLTTDTKSTLTKDIKNTKYWVEALRLTFLDMGDIAGALAIGASCDLTDIERLREVKS